MQALQSSCTIFLFLSLSLQDPTALALLTTKERSLLIPTTTTTTLGLCLRIKAGDAFTRHRGGEKIKMVALQV